MRVLLDENLPVEFAAELSGYDVNTVSGLGWTGLTNGELLRRAAGTYDALVTMDRNLEHQQDLTSFPLAVILVLAPSNRMRDLRALVPKVDDALESARPGRLIRVQG